MRKIWGMWSPGRADTGGPLVLCTGTIRVAGRYARLFRHTSYGRTALARRLTAKTPMRQAARGGQDC